MAKNQMTNPVITGDFSTVATTAEKSLISIQNNMDCVIEIVSDIRPKTEIEALEGHRGWLVGPGESATFEYIGEVNIKRASENTTDATGFITVAE